MKDLLDNEAFYKFYLYPNPAFWISMAVFWIANRSKSTETKFTPYQLVGVLAICSVTWLLIGAAVLVLILN